MILKSYLCCTISQIKDVKTWETSWDVYKICTKSDSQLTTKRFFQVINLKVQVEPNSIYFSSLDCIKASTFKLKVS